MYPNCMFYIKILAQPLLQIFCSQGCFFTQNDSRKREIIQSNISRILPNVKHVIYTLAKIMTSQILTEMYEKLMR